LEALATLPRYPGQAIKLGTLLAESEARLMLAAKARQVAEHERRQGLRLVINTATMAPPQA
jgi:hypothetical protein